MSVWSILSNEHNRLWLAQAGRQLIADLMRQSQKDPAKFYVAYDAMMQFLMNEQNKGIFEEELKQRRVADLSFWDVMLDFVLMDSFDDLARPPPAVYAVTKNMFLSHSMKDSTLTTHQNGFIAHFYNISEVISPTITLGFLGTDEHVRGLCQYFKEQTFSFVSDIFNINRVRYTELNELADDIWAILQSRIKTVQNRLTTEVVPVS
ncbi:unnamed protein product [Anisakis simplex]|uniref:Alpha-E domain-containing protein n=1 Tax=Anisakis simplex TaxID=6269 RepID=A0A0M3K9H1_ANISI|nr:unnamed protein product [Anisakis simplex]